MQHTREDYIGLDMLYIRMKTAVYKSANHWKWMALMEEDPGKVVRNNIKIVGSWSR